MAGKSPVTASNEQRGALMALAGSRDRGEADRARAVLLTLAGWTSPKIAEAFGVREDTVRLWRSDFANGGVGALKASVAPGPAPVKSEAALRVATPLLEEPVADRRNWTIPRLRAEIEAREGVRISRSQLSNGCPSMRPNSMISSRSGTISKPITSPTKPSPTPPRSNRPSMMPLPNSTASACPIRWPNRESLPSRQRH